jgi:hypothetical protein
MKTLGDKWPGAWLLVIFCSFAFVCLTVLLLTVRVRLEQMRSELDRMYLAAED